MTKQNYILRAAIAAMFTVGAGAAQAGLVKADGTTAFTSAKVASEMPTTGITLTGNGKLAVGTPITSFAPSSGQNLLINVALSGGAKFKTAPLVTCFDAQATGDISATLNLGGVGADSGTWTLSSTTYWNQTTAGSAGIAITGCVISASDLTVTGSHADVGITFKFTYGTLASSTVNGTYLTFARGLTADLVPGTDVTMNVSSGFVTTTTGATLVSAGYVEFTTNSTASTATLGNAIDASLALGATSGSITIAGAPLTATKVTGGVWLAVTGGACSAGATAGDANAVATAAGGTASVTFSGLTPTQMSAGLAVCMQFDGTTAVPAGSITASVAGNAVSGYSLNTAVTGNPLISIARNGTTLVAPLVQIPDTTNYRVRLALTNAGASAAGYTVQALSETGNTVTLTGAGASGTVPASGLTVVDLPTLMTATGTNRGSLIVTVSGTNANVSGVYQIVGPQGISNMPMTLK